MKRIGIFGGTFNPVHFGHLMAAQTVGVKLKLDQVIFVPCQLPPHKTERQLASARDRLQMVRLAIKDNPLFTVSDCEMRRDGKSYSVDSVRQFRDLYPPPAKLYFIIGGDALSSLHSWRRIDELLTMVTFVAVNRPGFRPIPEERMPPYVSVEMPGVDISSSFIRSRIAEGQAIEYFTPYAVVEYIRKKKLYQK